MSTLSVGAFTVRANGLPLENIDLLEVKPLANPKTLQIFVLKEVHILTRLNI